MPKAGLHGPHIHTHMHKQHTQAPEDNYTSFVGTKTEQFQLPVGECPLEEHVQLINTAGINEVYDCWL